MSSKKREEAHIPQIYASRTDVGNVREHNEDSLLISSPLFVVADGMGGHEAGEVASAIAVKTMSAHIPDSPDAETLADAVRLANDAVICGAKDGTGKPGMGTTMTAALIFDSELIIAQVGDSRAYLMHDGALQRVTRDHSLVADLVEQGRITEEEARYHPQRSVITRALGSDPYMSPDTYRLRVERDDRLMLCSDGLSSMIDDDAIEGVMLAHPDPQEACDALVAEALAAGGMDNVTVIVVDPLGVPEADDGADALDEAPASSKTLQPDARAQRRRERKRAGKGRKAPLIWALVFVLVIIAACGGFYAYAQNSYYLIAEDGHVMLYRGLPGEAAGLSFNWLEEETGIETSKLAPTTASRLERGISVDSEQEAQELIEQYRRNVDEYDAQTQTADTAQDPSATTGAGTGASTGN